MGDPTNNLTAKGNVPSWDAVRSRFWKNEAFYSAEGYTTENLGRMQRGLAPQRFNEELGRLESMELHHCKRPAKHIFNLSGMFVTMSA